MATIDEVRPSSESNGWIPLAILVGLGLLVVLSRGVSIDIGVVNVGVPPKEAAEQPTALPRAAGDLGEVTQKHERPRPRSALPDRKQP